MKKIKAFFKIIGEDFDDLPPGHFESRGLVFILLMSNLLITLVLYLLIHLLIGWIDYLPGDWDENLIEYIYIGLFVVEFVAYIVFVIWRVVKKEKEEEQEME